MLSTTYPHYPQVYAQWFLSKHVDSFVYIFVDIIQQYYSTKMAKSSVFIRFSAWLPIKVKNIFIHIIHIVHGGLFLSPVEIF